MCRRRMFLSFQSRALTAFGVIFLFIEILFGALAGSCGWAADRGVDQGGKWILVYKVDAEKSAWRPDKMDSLVTAISKRINASWWNGIYVRGLHLTKWKSACHGLAGARRRRDRPRRNKSERAFARQVHWNSASWPLDATMRH